MTLKRACTLMTVKAVNEDERIITGIASTPSPDRDGDIMEPEGAKFRSDTPFLWQHDRSQPIGTCTPKMVKEGLQITAKLVKPTADMPSQLVARLDEAWASIKAGLVRGLSIGFRPIEYSFLDEGGIRFLSWDLLEVSAVTIPANAECSINTVKSYDRQLLAASGNEKPVVKSTQPAGATAPKTNTKKGNSSMNIAEQIKSFEAKRSALAASLSEIMAKAAEDDAVAAIPVPQDGKSLTPDDVQPMLQALVTESMPVLPDVKALVSEAVAALPAPEKARDGEDGRDALALELLPFIDEGKSYPRGSYATHNGGLWRAYEKTHGMRGWECVVDGVAGVDIERSDQRRFTLTVNRLFLNLPSGVAQARTVQAVKGNVVTVTTAYSETPEAECCWGVDADDLFIALFRVTGTRDNDDGTFEVTGATYSPDIYAAVDTGARLDERPVSVIPPGVQAPPENIVIDSYSTVSQNIAITTMRAAWKPVRGAIAYEAEWRRDSGNWVSVPRTSSLGFEVPGIYAGRYLVRVRAVNASDVSSIWATSAEVTLTGKVGNPPKPMGFTASENVVFGIELNWGFPANTDDTLKTEIQYSLTGSADDAMLLADVPYPLRRYQQMGLKAGQIFWYRAQLVDRTGNESGFTDWARGQASTDVSDITDAVLGQIKDTDLFKDLIENAVDGSEKIAGMADDIKQNADQLELQAQAIKENSDGLAQAEVKIDEISVSMDGMTGGVKNSSIAIIQNSLAQVVSRRAQTVTNAGNSASIDRIDTTIADSSQAVASALMTLDANAGGNVSSATDLTETLASFTQASATKINSLSVTVNGQQASIVQNAQAVADINGNLNAMYSIKVGVDANGRQYAAGMGIGVENSPSGMQSQVLFLADRFAVMSQAGGSVTLPFVIQNGQTFINDAFFRDASIQFGKITDSLKSNNYAAGTAGWNLPKSGNAEFNQVTVRGAIYATNGNFNLTGPGNTTVINGLGVTVNLANGGLIRLGSW